MCHQHISCIHRPRQTPSWTTPRPRPVSTHLFIQRKFVEHLLCVRCCSKLWGSSSEQKDPCPGGMNPPVGLTGSNKYIGDPSGRTAENSKAVRRTKSLLQEGILQAAAHTEGGREASLTQPCPGKCHVDSQGPCPCKGGCVS